MAACLLRKFIIFDLLSIYDCGKTPAIIACRKSNNREGGWSNFYCKDGKHTYVAFAPLVPASGNM
ncbi:hypothetical protein COCSUDRAFT_33966 [Coccomyxa subellipsoidea C-169]|uniref:Uncharacterized protein n=1 Tax=Coccomyxa subellipsoidea (strain C-169) TaxID=574566 RepID=I0YPU0_COCSC|nr:hypothetical protein COCSUDRAFT_33966 [Coccomyxa subellipsoidea C-169]EIE20409.1 hypothetical protein COCSUDRAFT_33966 [Coccomyxa subellipsoidea C-169]|eukprot:XP_005644953.1 hypothetical protein COCSUDRAFT_33966 [Coccomyxa subellipsoidea C-169]